MKERLDKLNATSHLILDCAVGQIMHTIDYVFLGAEAVVENGGIINMVGSFTIALLANSHKK